MKGEEEVKSQRGLNWQNSIDGVDMISQRERDS